ncbi:MAG: AMP-binding protein, partial [Gammaproteobacteria bacterium]|nr:AMP-binding protein [Gammaproteobacteria bacterium]
MVDTKSSDKNIFNQGLDRNAANFQALTPLTFLARSALVYPNKTAVVHGEARYSYCQFYERCRRLASGLRQLGIGAGDTVAVMAPNGAPMLEAHYGIPMTGAALNALNFRLDAATIAFILDHGEAKALLTDREFSPVIKTAVEKLGRDIVVIDIDDPLANSGELLGGQDYEALLQQGDPNFDWHVPEDEWQEISLNYTSGTTGNPKGAVFHHRGAFLNALGNSLVFGLNQNSVYLWTLPMFHCNGWTYTWGVTAAAGTHVCLRQVDPAFIFPMIKEHKVTHMCGAPIVLNMLVHTPDDVKVEFEQTVEVATGGAAPPSAVIAAMERMGFRVTHLYGLTETYGPATVCAWQDEWSEMDLEDKVVRMARQGVLYPTLTDLMVADAE